MRSLLSGLVFITSLGAEEKTAAPPGEKELAAIRAEVAAYRKKLGDKAGVPEVADQFIPLPQSGRWLTVDEAQPAFAQAHPKLQQLRRWKIGLDPTRLEHALREPAAVVSGCVHAVRAGLDGAPLGPREWGLFLEFVVWKAKRSAKS